MKSAFNDETTCLVSFADIATVSAILETSAVRGPWYRNQRNKDHIHPSYSGYGIGTSVLKTVGTMRSGNSVIEYIETTMVWNSWYRNQRNRDRTDLRYSGYGIGTSTNEIIGTTVVWVHGIGTNVMETIRVHVIGAFHRN